MTFQKGLGIQPSNVQDYLRHSPFESTKAETKLFEESKDLQPNGVAARAAGFFPAVPVEEGLGVAFAPVAFAPVPLAPVALAPVAFAPVPLAPVAFAAPPEALASAGLFVLFVRNHTNTSYRGVKGKEVIPARKISRSSSFRSRLVGCSLGSCPCGSGF